MIRQPKIKTQSTQKIKSNRYHRIDDHGDNRVQCHHANPSPRPPDPLGRIVPPTRPCRIPLFQAPVRIHNDLTGPQSCNAKRCQCKYDSLSRKSQAEAAGHIRPTEGVLGPLHREHTEKNNAYKYKIHANRGDFYQPVFATIHKQRDNHPQDDNPKPDAAAAKHSRSRLCRPAHYRPHSHYHRCKTNEADVNRPVQPPNPRSRQLVPCLK